MGAQLIDPILVLILGLAITSLSGLCYVFKKSIFTITTGFLFALTLSSVISLIGYRLPNGISAPIPQEILSQTVETPFYLVVALFGGAASTYALAHPRPDGSLDGVANATALKPPLCAIGFGIAFINPPVMIGANLQFFTIFFAIAFLAIGVFR
jgi:uncharacterized membrane protein